MRYMYLSDIYLIGTLNFTIFAWNTGRVRTVVSTDNSVVFAREVMKLSPVLINGKPPVCTLCEVFGVC